MADTGAGEVDRRISADASGTFVAWVTYTDVRVLDTRDGSVAVTAAPAGFGHHRWTRDQALTAAAAPGDLPVPPARADASADDR